MLKMNNLFRRTYDGLIRYLDSRMSEEDRKLDVFDSALAGNNSSFLREDLFRERITIEKRVIRILKVKKYLERICEGVKYAD